MQKSHNIVLTIAYDGTPFRGWQETPTGRSIEEELKKVLTTILQHPVTLQAASRTDAGVHAQAQVVNFFTEKFEGFESKDFLRFRYRMNQLLPKEIVVVDASFAKKPDFHPTLSATSKEYHYFIANTKSLYPHLRHTHWHIPYSLNSEKMLKALPYFVGTHDFKSFCNSRNNLSYPDTIRSLVELKLEITDNQILKVILRGNNFLYKMARNIVGTLAYVGLGKIELETVPDIISKKSRIHAGLCAPALGLSLAQVHY